MTLVLRSGRSPATHLTTGQRPQYSHPEGGKGRDTKTPYSFCKKKLSLNSSHSWLVVGSREPLRIDASRQTLSLARQGWHSMKKPRCLKAFLRLCVVDVIGHTAQGARGVQGSQRATQHRTAGRPTTKLGAQEDEEGILLRLTLWPRTRQPTTG